MSLGLDINLKFASSMIQDLSICALPPYLRLAGGQRPPGGPCKPQDTPGLHRPCFEATSPSLELLID